MTFKEAKDILKKEFAVIGLHKSTEPFEFDDSNWFGYEKPSVLEAFRVLAKEGYYVTISGHDYNMRENRLKKEYEKNTKAPNPAKNRIKGNFPGNKSIEYCGDSMPGPGEEQPKEKKGIIYPTTFPKADFYYKHFLDEGNPALKESASQFNDALLDEQAKKIAELTKEKTNLEDQITILNACKEHNENFGRKQIKRLGKEIAKLNSIIHDKNAVLSDVAEELRLTKIREKNLAELGLKYVGENEELKKELADKVVDKIDAQALKSAESALAWKEKTITYKDMALAYYEKKIAEKDEVIADLGKELKATKTELEEKTKLVEAVRKSSKEDRDYGIAAEKMIQKMAKEIVNDSPVPSKDYKQYRLWANGYRFNPQLPDFSKEEEKKFEHAKKIRVSSDNAEEGADLYGVIVLCGKDYIDALKKAEDADIWQE